MRNVSVKLCTKNHNTHFMFNTFFFENRAVYEIMWKNMAMPDGRRKDAICLPDNEGKNKKTHTHSI